MTKPELLARGLMAITLSCVGGGAIAQVTSVVTSQGVFAGNPFNTNPGDTPFNPYDLGPLTPVGSSATQVTGSAEGGAADYNNYQVSTAVTATDIDFANGVTQLGSLTGLSTSTSVKITFTNQGAAVVVPTLQSDILPGGFGMYVGDPNLNPTFTSSGAIGDARQTPEAASYLSCCGATPTLAQLASQPGNYSMVPGFEDAIAGATFSFEISSNGVLVEDISGSLTISLGMTGAVVNLSPDAAAALADFGLVTSPSDPYSVGYQWDASSLTVPLGGPLAPGESDVVTYDTQVTAYTLAGTPLVFSDAGGIHSFPDLLAYSGFGDPIGKGSGGTPPAAERPGEAATAGAAMEGAINDVYFPRFQIGLPTFDSATGELSLPVSDQELPALPLTYAEAAVPEPEAWALMLAGVGGVGLAVRRRSRRQPA